MQALRAELERHFELDELLSLSRDLLGFDPERVGGQVAKGSFVRALTEHCVRQRALPALCDALSAISPRASSVLREATLRAQEALDLAPGASLAAFTITRHLGRGPTGACYVVRRADAEYRLKLLHPACCDDERDLQRYLTYCRVASTSETPLELGSSEGHHFVLQAHTAGEALRQRLARSGPLHPSEASPWIRGLFESLRRLHEAGVVHGNLKLENVLCLERGDGSVSLLDGGADRLRTRLARDGKWEILTAASATTAAPELLRGEAPTIASDLYAAGAIVYELLTGQPPFRADTPLAAAAAHLLGSANPPSDLAPKGSLPFELDRFVLGLLAKDPRQRPHSAGDALDALDALMLGRVHGQTIDPDEVRARLDALDEDPTNEELALSLETAADEGADPLRIADAFLLASRAVADQGGAEEAVTDLGFRAGRLFRRAGDLSRAEATYAELLARAPHNQAVRAALEDLQKRLGKHDELIEMWLGQAELADSGAERAQFMGKIGALYESVLGDNEQALVAFTQAYCVAPREAEYVHAVERLAGRDVAIWTDVLTSCAEAASEGLASEEQNAMLVQIGEWYSDRLGRHDLALECFQAVLASDAASDPALEGLGKIYRKSQQWPELAELLLQRADAAATPERARTLRAQAAEIFDRRLGNTTQAALLYEAIIEEDPTHAPANEALANLYQRAGDATGYVAVLRRQADNLRGAERLSMVCRIAEAFEDQPNATNEALDTYRTVLSDDPQNLGALRGLDRVYSKLGRFDQLLENLHAQTRLAATPRQKASLYERIAALYEEEFLDQDKAQQNYQAVLEIDPRSEQAMSGLERILRSQHRWGDLLEVYLRHAEHSEDPKQRAHLTYQRAVLLADELKSPNQAIVALEAVLVLDPEHADALTKLAELKQQSGDADEALAALDTLAHNAPSEGARADHYVRAARLLEKRNDLAGASERYKLALDAVPTHVDAANGLRAAYVKLGDAHAAVQMIHHQINQTESATTRGKLAAELARLMLGEFGDYEQARIAARQALEWNDTSLEAQEVLAEVSLAEGQLDEACHWLGRLVPQLEAMPKDRAIDVLVNYVETLSRQGSIDEALRPVQRLEQLAPDNPTAHLRIARALFDHGSPEAARGIFAGILERFDDRLDATERAQVTYYHAEATRIAGQLELAVSLLEEASDLDPSATAPLIGLAQAFTSLQDWEEVWDAKSRLLDLLDGDEKIALLVEMGELAMDKLGDRQRATRCLVAAVDVRPEDRKLLTRLMQLYSEDKDWAKAVDVVLKLAQFVDEPAQRARYLMTAGMVRVRELGDYDGALTCFTEVMELDPTLVKALEESVAIHRDRGDYEAAEQLLKEKMRGASAAKDTSRLLEAFTSLGELYRDFMQRPDAAVEAFEAAQTLDPDNRQRIDVLAELYAANSGEYFDKAVSTFGQILEHDPYRADAYSALRKLYTEAKNPDGAWLLCQALYVTKLAAPDEERFFKRMRAEDPAFAQEMMDDHAWAELIHPDQDPLLTDIFALIEPSVIATRGYEFSDLGYDLRHRIDLEHHRYPIGQTLHYAAGVMDMQCPPAFENTNDPGGLVFLDTKPPAISMGVGVLNPHLPPQMLAFIAGSHLSYYRPGHFLRQLVGTGTGLKSWLFAAIKLISPTFPLAADLEGPVSESIVTLQDTLTPQVKDELARAVSKLLQAASALDLRRWVSSVDLTADRVGLLLAHDLESAVEVVRGADDGTPGVAQQRLKELVMFSISPNYMRLRERLGINLSI